MDIKFDERGLICAIAQDAESGDVLMQAYMNEEALEKTLETGYAHYWSRSRKCLWKKGETSGHVQKVKGVTFDCDTDCVLLQIEQVGAACHTGSRSCFFNVEKAEEGAGVRFLSELERVIDDRKEHPEEGSYTSYLFEKGVSQQVLSQVIREANAERKAGVQVLVAQMNKNKKFQKEQLQKEGYTEFREFYKDALKK